MVVTAQRGFVVIAIIQVLIFLQDTWGTHKDFNRLVEEAGAQQQELDLLATVGL
jgi:hypothetical protein